MFKVNVCCPLSHYRAHRDWEDDFGVASEVSNMAIQGNTLLCCTSLAHSQGDAQDSISTKLS